MQRLLREGRSGREKASALHFLSAEDQALYTTLGATPGAEAAAEVQRLLREGRSGRGRTGEKAGALHFLSAEDQALYTTLGATPGAEAAAEVQRLLREGRSGRGRAGGQARASSLAKSLDAVCKPNLTKSPVGSNDHLRALVGSLASLGAVALPPLP